MSDGDIRFKWERVPGEDESMYGLYMYYRESSKFRIPATWAGEVQHSLSRKVGFLQFEECKVNIQTSYRRVSIYMNGGEIEIDGTTYVAAQVNFYFTGRLTVEFQDTEGQWEKLDQQHSLSRLTVREVVDLDALTYPCLFYTAEGPLHAPFSGRSRFHGICLCGIGTKDYGNMIISAIGTTEWYCRGRSLGIWSEKWVRL